MLKIVCLWVTGRQATSEYEQNNKIVGKFPQQRVLLKYNLVYGSNAYVRTYASKETCRA